MKLAPIILLAVAVSACILVPFALSDCAPSPNAPTAVDVADYSMALYDCVDRADARPAADSCRSTERAAFCAKWPSMPNCSPDGGRDAH